MASRSGPRASGTDGSDFSSREQIVAHYKASADLKTSVRKSILPHMMLTVLLVAKFFLVGMGMTKFNPLTIWEKIWLVSGVCAFIGFGGLTKNNVTRLMIYLGGNILFGVTPLVLGALELLEKVKTDFKDVKDVPLDWKNSPMKMAVVAVCFSWQFGWHCAGNSVN